MNFESLDKKYEKLKKAIQLFHEAGETTEDIIKVIEDQFDHTYKLAIAAKAIADSEKG